MTQQIERNNIVITQFINSFYSSNSYIINSKLSNSAWMIDCGDSTPLINFLKTNELKLKGIFLTHVHYDHIYGLNEILEYSSDFKLYTSNAGSENLINTKYNFSKYHEKDFIYSGNNINLLNPNDKIELFSNNFIHCIFTPGHDWSCITFQLDNFLFTGDSYIPKLKTVVNFPKSNKLEAIESERRIISKISESSIICPGHGDMIEWSKLNI